VKKEKNMAQNKSCFVIIGYGKKPSFANGKQRLLDLDQTYKYLIKPVFDELKIDCYRAIDKNLSGSIDQLMLEEIKNAEIAIVDLSTLNPNVMWELGVRHALKDKHTIMICEKEQMSSIPFDVHSFVIHQYVHSEEGIPITEAERFTKELKRVVEGVLNQDPARIDSPVFTFLASKTSAKMLEELETATPIQEMRSFDSIMKEAEAAKDQKRYAEALTLLAQAKKYAVSNMTLRDNLTLIVCRQALNTYKLELPNQLEAYVKAKGILDELNPDNVQDIEVLGLSGAINKRLYELTNQPSYLDLAIKYYEKGFVLKQDYYNGINTAFMLYKKASIAKSANDKEWEDYKSEADTIRNKVLKIAREIENSTDFGSTDRKDDIWVMLTIAEGYNYKENTTEMQAYEQKAADFAKKTSQDFAIDSYQTQKDKIESIKKILND
jgi:hypothetical protein